MGTTHSRGPPVPSHFARTVVPTFPSHHRVGMQSVCPGIDRVDPTVPSLPIMTRPEAVPSTSRVPSGVDRYAPLKGLPSWSVGYVSCGLPARSTRFNVLEEPLSPPADRRIALPSGRV